MKKHVIIAFSGLLFFTSPIFGQEETEEVVRTMKIEPETETDESEDEVEPIETFHSSRVINGHSVETLSKGYLELRIEHRFGDIGGENGGVQTLFGFDNVADMRFAFEYGITDKLMLGIGRSKGTGAPYKALLDGFVKYRILHQKKGSMPISMTVLGGTSYTYMKALEDSTSVASFPKTAHRLSYTTQLNIARSFGERFSLSVMPTVVHRNYVLATDVNTLFSLGSAARIGITSKFAILLEYYYNIHGKDIRTLNTNSMGIAFEFKTFGHNFTINLTNSKGFGETQFIPYTTEKWKLGQFRLGFSISRAFIKG